MKKHLIVYYGDATECVEGFGKDCKRSCKGALHVNPGRQMTVTNDELEFLKKKYKHMLPKLRILSTMKEEVKKESVKAEPKKENAAVKKVTAPKKTQEEGKKKRR